ncbi:MAG TPA: hypothetical protein VLC79_11945 [Cellvibrio sp.]|nr:hypothetical protein [Cellvibrio sp.]
MTVTTLIFYPDVYIGFNKTQLLERRLIAAGIIGSKFTSSPAFSMGPNFRQFIPKIDSIHKYHYGVIRIQIQSVGIWTVSDNRPKIFERSNIVLMEGDAIGQSSDSYALLRDLLQRITGDRYRVDVVGGSLRLGISEMHPLYG